MMNKEGSTKTMNFMTLRIWVVVLGHCHFCDKVKMLNLMEHCSSDLCHCCFSFILCAVDMQICALLTKKQFRVSDT